MNDKLMISLLYDFYGSLLNGSQQKVVELYVNSDLSYAESAEILGISRQGVKDSLDRAVKKLFSYEEKLHMLNEYTRTQTALEKIKRNAEAIQKSTNDSQIRKLSEEIEASADAIIDRED